MKKARMNISHSRFTLFKLKIFGEIVTTIIILSDIQNGKNFVLIGYIIVLGTYSY